MDANTHSRVSNDLAQFNSLQQLTKKQLQSIADYIVDEKIESEKEIARSILKMHAHRFDGTKCECSTCIKCNFIINGGNE